jgi:DNA-binding transcriptional regulator YhcF (GntR family)
VALRLGIMERGAGELRGRRAARARLRRQIRDRIVSGIHAGRYDAGDRLPTYRELGEELGANLRVVQSIYHELAEEGLVEVRGRSGVFVAPQERIGGRVLAETARWMVDVLTGARQRQITLQEFPELVRRCIGYRTLECACVESTEDQRHALCHELAHDYGLHTRPVPLSCAGAAPVETLRAALADADLVVTTLYHAADIREVAEGLGKPFAVVRLRREVVDELKRSAAGRGLTVVYVDPGFVDRVRLLFDAPIDVRGISVHDRAAIGKLTPSEPVLVSTAARRALAGIALPPPFSPGAMISTDSVHELIEIIIRLNLQAMRADQGDAS